MSVIIRETNLLEYPITFVKVEKISLASFVQISGELAEFLDFCHKNDIKTVYYKYSFYKAEDYKINDEILQRNTENASERKYCATWIEQYNQTTDSYDFENPSGLMLCASAGAFSVVFSMQNLWMQEEKAEDALISYLEKHEDELCEFFEYEEGPSLIDEFSAILLSDKIFRFCTNKESRSQYLERFMNKKDNKRFWVLTKGSKNEWDRRFQLNNIVNQIYNEYRNQCYKTGLKVGDELPDEEGI